jgi:hypothetical protein
MKMSIEEVAAYLSILCPKNFWFIRNKRILTKKWTYASLMATRGRGGENFGGQGFQKFYGVMGAVLPAFPA